MIRSILSLASATFLALAVLVPSAALAQPGPGDDPTDDPSSDSQSEIDEAVAKALFERGKFLFARGDHANAKQMFIESIERNANGNLADNALAMLRSTNERLGIKDLDHGSPFAETLPPKGDNLVDPYGDNNNTGDELADPYADSNHLSGNEPADPYAEDPSNRLLNSNIDLPKAGPEVARRRIRIWGGAYGALVGMAIAGPENDAGDISGGALLGALLGAGVGAGTAHFIMRKRDLTPGQGNALISGGAWGVYTIGFLGDTVTGTDTTTTNEAFWSMAIGGALGMGAGYFYAKTEPTEDDVAMVNSFGAYGSTTGLMLAVAIDPPETEAYSLNAAIGALGGLGVGYFMSKKYDVSQRRMLRVDLGALAGLAVTWALFYPLISDDGTNNDEQAAGLVAVGAMGVGAYVGLRLTRGMDDKRDTLLGGGVSSAPPPPPGLIQRDGSGRWSLGVPMPRPMENPALAPRTGARALGFDVVGGRF